MSEAMLRQRLGSAEASQKLRQIRDNMGEIAVRTKKIADSIDPDEPSSQRGQADVLMFPEPPVRRRTTSSRAR